MCVHHVFLFVCKNVFKDLCYTQISLIAFSECCTFISVSMLKLKSPTAATAIAEMTIRIRNEKSFHQIKYSICRAWKYKTYPDLGLAISFVTAVAPGARLPNGSHVAALLFWCYGAGAGVTPTPATRSELILQLQTKVPEDYAKFYNHGEGPYLGLLPVESTY